VKLRGDWSFHPAASIASKGADGLVPGTFTLKKERFGAILFNCTGYAKKMHDWTAKLT
jgi:hypothetical protein